jgi:A-factor biosynthesis hotdog domain
VKNTTIDSRLTNLSPAKLELLKLKLEKNKSLTSQKISESIFSAAYQQFRVWQGEFPSGSPIFIDKNLVHKQRGENVLISRLQPLENDFIIGEIFQNLAHTFFYEHSKDHVPGLYILEATRQFGTALTHFYYDVPLGTSFILNALQARFHRFAETTMPLYIMSKISDKVYLDNKLFQINNHAFIVQNEQVIAEVVGDFKIFEMTSYNNIRSRSTHSNSSLLDVNNGDFFSHE